jgi:hypothetical protein
MAIDAWLDYNLVGGLEHFLFFHILVLGRIIPTDELIFFKGIETNQ